MAHGVRTAVLLLLTIFSSSVSSATSVRISVKEGIPKLNQLIKNGQTALAISFIEAHPHPRELIHYVVGGGCSQYINCNPLQLSAQYGNLYLVKYLVEEMGMEVDYTDTNETYYGGNTALHEATIHDNIEVVHYLLGNGADLHREGKRRDGFTPLHYAASYSNLPIAALLVEMGADVNAAVQSKTAKRRGVTPLHLAVEDDNNFPVVDFLLANGAKIEQPDALDYTPLAFAKGEQNYTRGSSYEPKGECYGSIGRRSINRCQRDGRMWEHIYAKGIEQGKFLHTAIEKMRLHDIKSLIAADADPNATNGRHTPLQAVAGDNFSGLSYREMSDGEKLARTEVARLLLDSGADVNLNKSWFPPLHRAVQTKNAPLVELLLNRGADPTYELSSGIDAFQLARKVYKDSHHSDALRIVELLQDFRINYERSQIAKRRQSTAN